MLTVVSMTSPSVSHAHSTVELLSVALPAISRPLSSVKPAAIGSVAPSAVGDTPRTNRSRCVGSGATVMVSCQPTTNALRTLQSATRARCEFAPLRITTELPDRSAPAVVSRLTNCP